MNSIQIDLNIDIGEGFEFDEQLLVFASSANICCGAHAGSWELTQHTIGKAIDAGVRIGIHPGYPDRDTMGRKSVPHDDLERAFDSLRHQVELFFNFVPAAYLKPHGAFYGDSQNMSHPAFELLQELCRTYQLPLLGYPRTAHESASAIFIVEGFADRKLDTNGNLVPRTIKGAVLSDSTEIALQAVELADAVDSICLHGDNLGCVEHAAEVVRALLESGYEVCA
jgi:UPF0271 protein